MSEQVTSPSASPEPTGPLLYNSIIRLTTSGGNPCWGPMSSEFNANQGQNEYYPTLAPTSIPLMLVSITSSSGPVHHGDSLKIQSLEASVGVYNYLGAWSTPSLYYYNNAEAASQLNWTIQKVGGKNGDPILCSDYFVFVNDYYSGQGIAAYGTNMTSTTNSDDFLKFTVQQVPITSGSPVVSGQSLNLFLQDGSVISTAYSGTTYWFPTLAYSPAPMTADIIIGSPGELKHGDTIYLKTQEDKTGAYNIMSAYSGQKDLYYYEYDGYKNPHQCWTIQKRDTSVDQIIRFGDPVYLLNQSYNEFLSPHSGYVTTASAREFFWYFLPA